MNRHQFQQTARHFRSGRISLNELTERVFGNAKESANTPSTTADKQSQTSIGIESDANDNAAMAGVDLERAKRGGWPEVVYGSGKSAEAIIKIGDQILGAGQSLLVARVEPDVASTLQQHFENGVYQTTPKLFRVGENSQKIDGSLIVVSARTSDLPVAEEAVETIRWMGGEPELIVDVGVGGPQRMEKHLDKLRTATAIVVVAGMEKTLPSTVAGQADCPIFAVPTRVADSASTEGISAFLTMIESCAANVAMVNIDAGFKAGYLAAMVARQISMS
jgi:NCAIR mutase (PurE)-related protein